MECNVIILAAGRGSRLGNLTSDIPKCLLEIEAGVTILDTQLSSLFACSYIKNISIVVGYRSKKIIDLISRKYPSSPITFCEVPKFSELNNAHSLLNALADSEKDTSVLQINSDVLFDPRILAEARETLLQCPMDEARIFTLTGICEEEEMKVSLHNDQTISALSKKSNPMDAAGEAFGINYYAPRFIQKLVPALQEVITISKKSYFEDGVNIVLNEGIVARPYMTSRMAMEIDFSEDLTRARTQYSSLKRDLNIGR